MFSDRSDETSHSSLTQEGCSINSGKCDNPSLFLGKSLPPEPIGGMLAYKLKDWEAVKWMETYYVTAEAKVQWKLFCG
jgi:hypothetical protein